VLLYIEHVRFAVIRVFPCTCKYVIDFLLTFLYFLSNAYVLSFLMHCLDLSRMRLPFSFRILTFLHYLWCNFLLKWVKIFATHFVRSFQDEVSMETLLFRISRVIILSISLNLPNKLCIGDHAVVWKHQIVHVNVYMQLCTCINVWSVWYDQVPYIRSWISTDKKLKSVWCRKLFGNWISQLWINIKKRGKCNKVFLTCYPIACTLALILFLTDSNRTTLF